MCVKSAGPMHEVYWRGMIRDWQDEWDLKRRGSYRIANRHDTCRVAASFNQVIDKVVEIIKE